MKNLILCKILFIFILFINFKVSAKDFIIKGNKFTDEDILISIIGEIPDTDEKSKSNYILKELNNSGLFQTVEISYDDNNYYINVIEFSTINKFVFNENQRIKDEEIDNIINELDIFTLSEKNINYLIDELTQIYQSFGYNNIEIEYRIEKFDNNSADVYLIFDEGKITKIKKINIIGNTKFDTNIILSKIKSKTKKITNIFANNNFKLFQVNSDTIRIKDFYKSQGYKDVNVDFNIEYFSNNKVEINFVIDEGKKYFFSSLKIQNNLSSNNEVNEKLKLFIDDNFSFNTEAYNTERLDQIEIKISKILENSGIQYFSIKTYEKISEFKANILFEISPTKPIYVNQINLTGNTRTYDYVIRRELEISEGDPINETKIKQINRKLNQLPFFGSVDVETDELNEVLKDININVEETQTGSFNVGLSIGTLDGASFVTGLKEKNINGTGRSLEFLINTSEDNRTFTLSTTEKFVLNNQVNHKYSTFYKENDFSKSKSYKLNTFSLDTSFKYLFSDNVYHTIGLGYSLKDYIITNSNTVSSNILEASGESISFNISNEITRNTLNSFIRPTNGNYISFVNYLETPSSSANGFIKNIITGKKYYNLNNNILSVQARAGNIYSLNNNEILSDDKFSLGGRWLRGFDNFGAGPRNSRSTYVGGNNLLVAKFDYSKPITLNDQNPIYFNIFNDYGMIWGNKNEVTSSDQDLRASYGFGFNYYSPIGPIGFTWGFPLADKDYDVKRMFLFSVGNLN